MIKQTFSGLILGFILTLFTAQRSEWVHHELETAIQNFCLETLDCQISCKVARANFFFPTLELADVHIEPLRGEMWRWQAKRYITGFSWLNLLLHRSINMWIELHDLDAHSDLQSTEIAILPHLKTLLTQVEIDIPVDITSLAIKHGRVELVDAGANRVISVHAHADLHNVRGQQKVHVSFLSGSGTQHEVSYFTTLGGTLSCTLRDDNLIALSSDAHCIIPHLDAESPLFVVGQWQDAQGAWRIYNAENSFNAQVHVDSEYRMDGSIACEKLTYAQYPYELTGKFTFSKRDAQWQGALDANVNGDMQFAGSWKYDQTADAGNLVCTNKTNLSLPSIAYWHLAPDAIQFNLARTPGKFQLIYAGTALHELLGTSNAVRGEVVLQDGKAQLHGSYNDETYCANMQFDELPYLIDAEYLNAAGAPQLNCAYGRADGRMRTSVQFSFIRNFIKRWFNYDVQGQGELQLDVTRSATGWSGKMHLVDGAIRLPETYNFINGIDAAFSYDQAERCVRVNDLVCELHSGRVRCPHASIWFDENHVANVFHIPLLFEHCLLNFKRDLFATVSGRVTATKQKDAVPLLAGNLFIERAQLKENLLSQEFQKQLFAHSGNMVASHAPDMHCDLTIETMHPIRIDTNVLKTNAQVHIAIKNSFANPEVSGALRLVGGTIEFPYKPLNITEGALYLLPGQLHNPMVELRANNTIKNHTVSLQVTGLLSAHHIMFDSTPPLSEEQIIALLLVGSHDESLATMAPALLVQNLKHALFGINEPTVFDKYMSKIAKPLNIHLVPSFTDQTGRGGLRGALEIDVNDRWRALIQKNFTLTEDTRFELDYLLSDDITIRAIRDERRDVGGEVEVKWKM